MTTACNKYINQSVNHWTCVTASSSSMGLACGRQHMIIRLHRMQSIAIDVPGYLSVPVSRLYS